jgi:hypothetical protein
MMAAAPAAAPAPPVSRQPQRTGPDRGRDGWRRWRLPAALIGLIIAAAALIALLQPAQPAIGYLDPADTGPYGTHALADILAGRGTTVVAAATPAAAKAAAAQSAATIVITSPEYLSRSQLAALATAGRDVVIVEPDAAALAALAPRAAIAGAVPIATAAPVCGLTAAILAGNADMGGTSLRLRPGTAGAASCYRVDGLPSLVQYASAGRIITILGTGAPLTNSYLARHGNAALALNLLGAEPRAVWLVPAPAAAAGAEPASGGKTLGSLIPLGAYLVAIQLAIAVLLAALWRWRRLGPLVSEQLPVVVRASETVEGHGRLYAARRARGRAAAALRTAMLTRVLPGMGLPPGAAPDSVTSALAARSGLAAARITEMVYGQAPDTDAALVALADELDALEREVLAQ